MLDDSGPPAGKSQPYASWSYQLEARAGLGDLLQMLYCIGQVDAPTISLYSVPIATEAG